jgi:hypothetical protein
MALKSEIMKNLLITLLASLFLIPMVAFGQDSPTDNLFKKYSGKEGYTTVQISKELFGMLAQIDDQGDPKTKEMKEALGQLEFIRVLMLEDCEDQAMLNSFKDELKKFELQNFKELMVVNEEDEEVKFLARKNGGEMIEELLLVINSNDKAGFVSIVGLIDMNTISKLSHTMGIKGMENLEELNDQ